MSLSPEQLEQFVDDLVRTPGLWREHIRHDGAARVYAEIWSDEHVNAWLICWSEDQDTGFHDHDRSGAAIAVINGQVREERLRLAAAPDGRVIGPGETFFVAPTAIHRVLHSGDRPAVTMHAYSPPLTRTGAYRVGAGGELEREALSSADELRAEAELALRTAAAGT